MEQSLARLHWNQGKTVAHLGPLGHLNPVHVESAGYRSVCDIHGEIEHAGTSGYQLWISLVQRDQSSGNAASKAKVGTGSYRTSERKALDNSEPLFRIRGFGDEFEVQYILPDRAVDLMREHKACKWTPPGLPRLGECLETNVLREKDPIVGSCSFQQVGVLQSISTIFLRRQNVHASTPKLIGDLPGDVNVHVERNRHSHPAFSL